ncbi:MAG: SUMF1/EgtB/PvdO family nonheme iron enzyme [Candidatus Magasanikbacteria bacterium]|jgi:hypothetical protein|nr:SUMF1/EgtB/PvdO family nonheme iron enzyme [Candidatus Magasanikbacteria bacterium]
MLLTIILWAKHCFGLAIGALPQRRNAMNLLKVTMFFFLTCFLSCLGEFPPEPPCSSTSECESRNPGLTCVNGACVAKGDAGIEPGDTGVDDAEPQDAARQNDAGPTGDTGQATDTGGDASPTDAIVHTGDATPTGDATSSTELCNGLDDDTDGTIDETPIEAGQPCNEGIPDGCNGSTVCEDGAVQCRVENANTPELCNGVDDNCNGAIDEGNPEGDAACDTNVPGICAEGETICEDGVLNCLQLNQAGMDICDGMDNDCNGGVDDDCGEQRCQPVGSERPCYSGRQGTEDVGPCRGGQQRCGNNNLWGSCIGEVTPLRADACDGVDNDCDGSMDEDFRAGEEICLLPGREALCQVGLRACAEGRLICVENPAHTPQPERCDGVDNDCDGFVDDAVQAVVDGFFCNDPCEDGQEAQPDCRNGEWMCRCPPPLPIDAGIPVEDAGVEDAAPPPPDAAACQPRQEICDGMDNDCDGRTDEGFGNIGQPCSAGVGACRNDGQIVCTDDGLNSRCSAQAGSPTPEVCDGVDNDCNGISDDGVEESMPCSTGQPGICNPGMTRCGGNVGMQCISIEEEPLEEQCDNQDNDCDSIVDEGVRNACGQCGPPPSEVCNGRDDNCDGRIDEGVVNACGECGVPPAEICDSEDNDCDGRTDENLICDNCNAGEERSCYNADAETEGIGVCQGGIQRCLLDLERDEIRWGTCEGMVTPSAEICDGLDNNCDGSVDGGNPGGGIDCSTGLDGVCAAGSTECRNGAIVCSQIYQGEAEVCDGFDNNCNGTIDEGNPGGGRACHVAGQMGACADGGTSCRQGELICVQLTNPEQETCNQIDDDCDGTVDENRVCEPCEEGYTLIPYLNLCVKTTEVTVAEYEACANCAAPATQHEQNSQCNGGAPDRANHPINCVSWTHANAFCQEQGGRLVTLAEMNQITFGEHLERRRPWGNEGAVDCNQVIFNEGAAANTPGCGANTTAPVCSRPLGNTPEGICDTVGNAREWTADGPCGAQNGHVATACSWVSGQGECIRENEHSFLCEAQNRAAIVHGFRCVQEPRQIE